ncbi:class II fructose-bisphosphate aldolase [Candidatus Uhrbacteria bacterium]|nr:class II fructose-bisphosphate aldolase [Candidatus Uhrbacteria bacterium]
MLVTSKSLLAHANKHSYALAHFNFSNLESLQAVVQAALLEKKSSVIIATTESAIAYAGLPYLKALAYMAAMNPIKIALHLDHGRDLRIVKQCIDMGYTSVMFDGSNLSYKENVAKTKKVVAWARTKGVSVEGELGALRGKEDKIEESKSFFTDPKQALDFVKKTSVDVLAISIGTAHGPYKFTGETHLDYDRLKRIKALTRMPLVLHGASGVSEELTHELHNHCEDLGDCARLSGAHGVSDSAIRKAIRCGINKINIDSDLRIAFVKGIRTSLLEKKEEYDPRVFLGQGREEMVKVARQKIRLFRNS